MRLMELATQVAAWNLHAMALWCFLALAALGLSLWQWRQDQTHLQEVRDLTTGLSEMDHAGKMAIQQRLFDWAEGHRGSSLAYAIAVGNNAAVGGALPDASAITDAIWSHERLRHGAFKFFQRHVILLGLFFTSAGLVAALGKLGPVVGRSDQEFEAWAQAVREALGGSLAGMGHAFISSLLALFLALLLQGLWQLVAERAWNRHLMALDTLLQGRVIPVFTSLAQKDRNDVITVAMGRVEHALLEVRDQYAALLEEATEGAEHLAQLQTQLVRSSESLQQASDSLAKEHQALARAAPAYVQGAQAVAHATKVAGERLEQVVVHGMRSHGEALHERHQELNRLVELQAHHLKDLADQGRSQLVHLAHLEERMGLQSETIERVVAPLNEVGNHTQGMNRAVQHLQQGVASLASLMQAEEAAWANTWVQRRHQFEENVRQLGQSSGQALAKDLLPILQHHLQQLGQLVQQQLEQAHQAQQEAENTRDRRWNELVGALSGRP